MELQGSQSIHEHAVQRLSLTAFVTEWIPSSTRFVALGIRPSQKGCIQVYELAGSQLRQKADAVTKHGVKCGTFAGSIGAERLLATGDFGGGLQLWDLERLTEPVSEAKAHAGLINAIDGAADEASGGRSAELVTGGKDGAVCIWDARTPKAALASFEDHGGGSVSSCWAVAFGNSCTGAARCVLAGYENGDIRMYDLRTASLRWQENVGKGVCGLSFDRRDIPMNKFLATCLDGQIHVYDARTQHPTRGFARASSKLQGSDATVWGVNFLPQNRDICMLTAGDGGLHLYRYQYPEQRTAIDPDDGGAVGVAAQLRQLAAHPSCTQPILGLSWHPDKLGLFCCAALDQCVRVGFVTGLNKL